MREIVLDTETTGFSPKDGDRIVEIGCVELMNYLPTGETFHAYINPQREMPAEAFKVHGLSSEFLSDKPKFLDVARFWRPERNIREAQTLSMHCADGII